MKSINIRWSAKHASYKVDCPNWNGGRVYMADEVDAEILKLKQELKLLNDYCDEYRPIPSTSS